MTEELILLVQNRQQWLELIRAHGFILCRGDHQHNVHPASVLNVTEHPCGLMVKYLDKLKTVV